VVRRFALDTGGGDAHPRRQLREVLVNSTRTSERRISCYCAILVAAWVGWPIAAWLVITGQLLCLDLPAFLSSIATVHHMAALTVSSAPFLHLVCTNTTYAHVVASLTAFASLCC
jgi:hypothetical protein